MSQIEKEHLEEINILRNSLATVISDAGQISLQIQMLESDIVSLRTKHQEQTEKFRKLLEEEQILIKRLSEKYGVGEIDFDTGEFTPEK